MGHVVRSREQGEWSGGRVEVALWYVYTIFIVYLSDIYHIFIVYLWYVEGCLRIAVF